MCAASPARNSRPYRIGSWTWLRIGSTLRSVIGPGVQLPPVLAVSESAGERVPDLVVGPAVRIGARRHLQIEPADRRPTASSAGRSRPGARRRSARRSTVRHRRGFRTRQRDTYVPTSVRPSRDRPSAGAEGPVAAGDHVGLEPLPIAVAVDEGHRTAGRSRGRAARCRAISYTNSWPAASRASTRSLVTSVWPYTHTLRPTRSTKSRWCRSSGHCR